MRFCPEIGAFGYKITVFCFGSGSGMLSDPTHFWLMLLLFSDTSIEFFAKLSSTWLLKEGSFPLLLSMKRYGSGSDDTDISLSSCFYLDIGAVA